MPDTAESHLVTLTTNRICVIEIKNDSTMYCLYNPKVHMESGFSHSPPTPTLGITKTEVCSFTKDDNTASGAVGVLTYELFHMRERKSPEMMAIMFSVPYDYNFYQNWLGLGVFESSVATDHELFDQMYKSKDFTNFVRYKSDGSGIVFKGKSLDLRACMSDEGRAIVKLELFDKMGR
ncbi:bryoporin-like [Notolabrus celidotus]|uniref:bryoporin-like n=1 Tax=Notolabrus celidotus TaxID=1203425 RepID=UPI00148F8823|nr:bryoporin-like [Notolabrus celidotus]XP_034563439.1 bryoporin-like [Notolabrus celidotus]XP_034563440.1 bryoporin-like [Notolabrus celidotus]XP_034563441.1 bryoporin-like [Notolabrus celidotus]XP_034563442.1 bryoporin-like [Notolabrus celidotus]XP_034563443.1 bryoporin-like [Notolabrus celidotus]